jgi:hypothetical protein
MCHFPFVRYGYAGKAGAIVKSVTPNTVNVARYGYGGKAGTAKKSAKPNAGNAVPYGYADKAGTALQSLLPNDGKGTSGKVKGDVFGTSNLKFKHRSQE